MVAAPMLMPPPTKCVGVNTRTDMETVTFKDLKPEDRLKQVARADGLGKGTVADCHLSHCLLSDKHLKEVAFVGGAIVHSRFLDCKLTDAAFDRVDLTGTKFVNCDLKNAQFLNCRTWYVTFENCELNYASAIAAAPHETNLRRAFLRELRANATQRCERRWADRLLMLELRTRERELLDIVFGTTDYYRKKYSGWDRVQSCGDLLVQLLNRFWWGYGLRLSNLTMSGIFVLAVFGLLHRLPSATYAVASNGDRAVRLSWFQACYYSVISFTTGGAGDIRPASTLAQVLTSAEALAGVLFLGFFAAAMYRRLSE